MMRPLSRDSEIIESKEHFPATQSKISTFSKPKLYEVVGIKCGSPVQNDLIRLFDALDIKTPSRSTGHSYHNADSMQKRARTRNVMVNAARGSGIGVSESVNLKKALRRLCVSQASEMAAMKRLSKPIGLSGVSEAGTIKRLYSTIIVGAGEIGEKEEDMLAISLIPKKKILQSPEKEVPSYQVSNIVSSNGKIVKPRTHYAFALSEAKAGSKISASVKSRSKGKVRHGLSSGKAAIRCKASEHNATPPPTKAVFKRKCSSKMEEKHCQSPTTHIPGMNNASDRVDIITNENKQEPTYESAQVSNFGIMNTLSCSKGESSLISKLECTPNNSSAGRVVGTRTGRSSKSKTKGEYSHSSKSSLGDFSSSTSISNESSSSFGSRPHMSKDSRWISIRNAERQHGKLGLRNFTLLKRLGCGDIGTVYLAELTGSETLFALKIMDNDYLVSRKKMLRAETEREILQMLDHPFLPTLYTHFTSDNLSCLVMEYCPGGDLHVLRQQQPGRSFTEPAARFYVAEVLLSLEYLHMLGVIYRDLKPENILVREDGHIMLSDFDLSLRCAVNPTLLRSFSLAEAEAAYRPSGPCSVSSCIDPLCLQPSWVHVSCFTSHPTSKNKKVKSEFGAQPRPLPQLVAEPTEARSNSFVGTHEYLAPEIIKGEGHGSSVDWWTLGIFLYELLFGRTPFKGIGNEETLTNIVCESLMFPECPNVSFHAIDLIRGLLVKEPENRLGSVKGAAEIKQHVFFRGLNWALIRCTIPPEVPASCNLGLQAVDLRKKEGTCSEFSGFKSNIDFELF